MWPFGSEGEKEGRMWMEHQSDKEKNKSKKIKIKKEKKRKAMWHFRLYFLGPYNAKKRKEKKKSQKAKIIKTKG